MTSRLVPRWGTRREARSLRPEKGPAPLDPRSISPRIRGLNVTGGGGGGGSTRIGDQGDFGRPLESWWHGLEFAATADRADPIGPARAGSCGVTMSRVTGTLVGPGQWPWPAGPDYALPGTTATIPEARPQPPFGQPDHIIGSILRSLCFQRSTTARLPASDRNSDPDVSFGARPNGDARSINGIPTACPDPFSCWLSADR